MTMNAERLSNPRGGVVGLPEWFARWMATTLAWLLGLAALAVVARRLGGALVQPLEPSTLLATGTLIAAAAFGIRVSRQGKSTSIPTSHAEWRDMIGVSLIAAAFGLALNTTGVGAMAAILFWTPLAAEEIWAWRRVVRRQFGRGEWIRRLSLRLWRQRNRRDRPARIGSIAESSCNGPAARLDEAPAENVRQQLIRSHAANGVDTLSGFARATFGAGQRTGSVHVAFCPPFGRTPALTVKQLEGPVARIKTAQLLPYGVRLDLKLAVPAEPSTMVLLQFTARESDAELS